MRDLICITVIALNVISCQPTEMIEDIVVIGGGLMGSSTAWQLSKNGQNVLLIEQQDSIYTFGSSFGEARITRSLGPNEDIFSFLHQTSVKEIKDLIEYLNEGETEILHSMEDIYTTSPVTYVFSKAQLNAAAELTEGQKDTFEYASNANEAFEKFGMIIPDTMMVLREYKQFTGTLNPKILIKKLHKGIRKSGNRIDYNQKVTSLKKENGIYRIEITDTKNGTSRTIFSKKVVAAAGPYNGTLVKEIAPYFGSLIKPKRLFLSFLEINPDKYDSLTIEQQKKLREYYPAIAYFNPEGFYTMIEKYDEENRPLLKIGGHYLRTDIENLDSIWAKELTPSEIQWSKENTANYLAKLNLPIELSDLKFNSGYSCVYSLTASEIPYVTHSINNGTVVDSSFVLVGGMSGVGAKGSLAYGLFAADLILNNKNDSFMYQKTKSALGSQRLMKDINRINN